ncbi:hypothetical protein [Bacillus sp. FSL K6-0067]|uniref:hypothetical protein n=1 Tax=Bacillus sp. FSL K6-0067 TaxID=2921412 RepID=UPI00077AA22D|nr:hypothetical protein [Bacillus cereus]KXY11481.1 hypothetical protein AT267_17795 [Bacillus cereus]
MELKAQTGRLFELMDEMKIQGLKLQLIADLFKEANKYFAEGEKCYNEHIIAGECNNDMEEAEKQLFLYERCKNRGYRLRNEAIKLKEEWDRHSEMVDKETDEIMEELREQINNEKENGVQA